MALSINGTTGVSGVDGSNSSPAIQGTDSNTGLSFASDTVNINTGGATKVTVDSSGNVGIGETTPLGKLHVKTADSAATAEVSADELVVEGSGHSGISVLSGTGSAGCLNFGDSGDNDIGRVIYHHATNHMQFNTNGSERMRIDSSGNFLVGGTAVEAQQAITIAPNRPNGAGRITTNRANTTNVSIVFEMQNNGSQVGRLEHDHTGAALVSGSDYRLKENDVAISDGITRVKQLRPIRYNWKSEPSKTLDGFFAHEVSSIVPEAVSGEKDAVDSDGNIIMQGMVTERLVPLLTAALQEAVAKIEVLETKVAALEAG